MIVKMITGSHLFGTSTPQSDTDYKGIFMSPLRDIILGISKDDINFSSGNKDTKNNSTDVDTDLKELRKFIKDCKAGQTYALEMLFAPKEYWVESTPIWDFIVSNRNKLLSHNYTPFVGYAKGQAKKYSLRGDKLRELNEFLELLENSQEKKLIEIDFKETKHIFFENKFNKTSLKDEKYLYVVCKHFPANARVKEVYKTVKKLKEEFGFRANQAMENNSIDWKAYSHSLRICYELEELQSTGKLTLPCPQARYLTEVKQGLVDINEVQDEIERLIDIVTTVEPKPSEFDEEFWDNWLVELYKLDNN